MDSIQGAGKGVQSFTQGEKAVALIPFWTAVARASSQDDAEDPMHNMQYATAIIQIPTPRLSAKGCVSTKAD